MPDKKRPQAEPISFEHLGGKKVAHPVPEKREKEIDFSAIGGKVVRRASDHPMFNAKPEENDDEAHTDFWFTGCSRVCSILGYDIARRGTPSSGEWEASKSCPNQPFAPAHVDFR